MCKHNAAIYGVEEFITIVCGDFFDFAKDARAAAKAKATRADEGKWGGAEKLAFDV